MRGDKLINPLPLFDPHMGETLVEPLGRGPGWWAGAPSVLYDHRENVFYLYYRLRKPRGMGRGFRCIIAKSRDGRRFEPVWEASREDFDSPSIERGTLLITPERKHRLYLSYVDGESGKWRIDLLEANSFEKLNPHDRKKVLVPQDIGAEGVKDPVVIMIGRAYFMAVAYAVADVPEDCRDRLHATFDVHATGLAKTHTGIAVSHDGVRFQWLGEALAPGEGRWDAYTVRLTALLPAPPAFLVFYDGCQTVKENYEERTGMAITFDLLHYNKLTPDGPILVSPHASGSLRYVDVVPHDNALYFYYEYAREDGAHELRVSVVPRS